VTNPSTAEEWLDARHAEVGNDGSDRTVAIVAAAMLDVALKELLQRKLLPPRTKRSGLFSGANAPMGNLGACIDAAHQLGLITAKFADDLDGFEKSAMRSTGVIAWLLYRAGHSTRRSRR